MTLVRKNLLCQIQRFLSESSSLYNISDGSLSTYGLEHSIYHHAVLHHSEEIWSIARNEDFRKEQYKRSNQFDWGYRTLRYGIAHYVGKQGETSTDDARLAWLVLKGGEYAREAIENVNVAFEWFRDDVHNLDMVFQRLEVLDEKAFFKACLRLMMIEARRQKIVPREKRDIEIPQNILERIEKRVPENSEGGDGTFFLVPEFMGYWVSLMVTTWNEIGLDVVYKRGTCDIKLLECLVEESRSFDTFERFLCIKEVEYVSLCVFQEALSINDEIYRLRMLVEISTILARAGIRDKALEVVGSIDHGKSKMEALFEISKGLMEFGKAGEVLDIIHSLDSDYWKSKTLIEISKGLIASGRAVELLEVGRSIKEEVAQSKALIEISKGLIEIGKKDEGNAVFEEALAMIGAVRDERKKSKTLIEISKGLIASGREAELLIMVHSICDDVNKIKTLLVISKELEGQDDELFDIGRSMKLDHWKSKVLIEVSKGLIASGRAVELLEVGRSIKEEVAQSKALIEISKGLIEGGKVEDGRKVLEEVLEVVRCISNRRNRSELLIEISKNWVTVGREDELLKIAYSIGLGRHQWEAFVEISKVFMKVGKKEEALKVVHSISDDIYKWEACVEISTILMLQGKTEEALEVARSVGSHYYRSKALVEISKVLIENGKEEEALKVVHSISDNNWNSKILIEIFHLLIERGEGTALLDRCHSIKKDEHKWEVLIKISKVLIENGKEDELLQVVRSVESHYYRSKVLIEISKGLMEVDKKRVADVVFEEALTAVLSINDERNKSEMLIEISKLGSEKERAQIFECVCEENPLTRNESRVLVDISKVLVERDKGKDALKVVRSISNEQHQLEAFVEISKGLIEGGKEDELLHVVRSVESHYYRSKVLIEISKGLIEVGKKDEGNAVLEEVLDISISRSLDADYWKSKMLIEISKMLMQSGLEQEDYRNRVCTKLLKTTLYIIDEYKFKVLQETSKKMIEIGKENEILEVVRSIHNVKQKSRVLVDIFKSAVTLAQKKKIFEVACSIRDENYKARVLSDISKTLLRTCVHDRPLEMIHSMLDVIRVFYFAFCKIRPLLGIFRVLTTMGEEDEGNEILDEVWRVVHTINDNQYKLKALLVTSIELKGYDQEKEVLEAIRCISNEWYHTSTYKTQVLVKISKGLIENGKEDELLQVVRSVESHYYRSKVLIEISKGLMEVDKKRVADVVFEEALTAVLSINDERNKSEMLKQLIRVGAILRPEPDGAFFEEGLMGIRSMDSEYWKSKMLIEISKALIGMGKEDEGNEILEEVWKVVYAISDDENKIKTLLVISENLEGSESRMLDVVRSMNSDDYKSKALIDLSKILIERGKEKELIQEVYSIRHDFERLKALIEVSKKLMVMKGGIRDEDVLVAFSIKNDDIKSEILSHISKVFIREGRVREISQFLINNPGTDGFYKDFLPKHQAEIDTTYLRCSFLLSPFAYECTEHSVLYLVRNHFRERNNHHIMSIIRECPQLHLDFLLQGEI